MSCPKSHAEMSQAGDAHLYFQVDTGSQPLPGYGLHCVSSQPIAVATVFVGCQKFPLKFRTRIIPREIFQVEQRPQISETLWISLISLPTKLLPVSIGVNEGTESPKSSEK